MLALEELLIIVLQFIAELLVDIVVWIPWDLLVWWGEEKRRAQGTPSKARILLGGFAFGAIVGAMSLWLRPTTMLKYELARLLNLFVAPVACGVAALAFSRVRLRRGRRTDPKIHFWFAIAFSAAFLLVRFTWADRPHPESPMRALGIDP